MQGSVTHHRFYRSRRDRMVAGVSGGLAQYFGVDPVLVRIAFVVLTLSSGVGLLAYIILAVVVPERPAGEEESVMPESVANSERGRQLAGYALLGLGLLVLASNLGLYRIFDLGRFWPVLVIGAGVLLLARRRRED